MAELTPALRIVARRAGFRRAGRAHPAEPVLHPAGSFSAEQVEALLAETMLRVEIVVEGSLSASGGTASPPAGADTAGGAESVAGSDAGSKSAGDPEDVDASGGGDGAVPSTADGVQAPDAQPGAATPAPGPDAQSEGAAGSNPVPDGNGQPGDQAGPGAAVSKPAAPVTADAKPSRNRKVKT